MPKTALVTGASTGIGKELCKLMAKDGYELFLVARDAARLKQVASELMTMGCPSTHVIPVDLALRDGPRSVEIALSGTVPDVLVNNAGFGLLGDFDAGDLNRSLDMIQVNVTSLVELTGRLLPAMVRRSHGRIMNVASTASFQPGPGMAIYYATKAFVLSFSEAIAEENRRKGISVTVLCPGPTDTEFQSRAGMLETPLFKGGLGVMTAAAVAEIGYRAMLEGKVLSIAGLRNRLGMEGLRLAPRSWVRRIVYGLHKV
jgi:short-subunit dehydrogenase